LSRVIDPVLSDAEKSEFIDQTLILRIWETVNAQFGNNADPRHTFVLMFNMT
jgi:hypothetical protein